MAARRREDGGHPRALRLDGDPLLPALRSLLDRPAALEYSPAVVWRLRRQLEDRSGRPKPATSERGHHYRDHQPQ